jgi:cell division topological specificity factor
MIDVLEFLKRLFGQSSSSATAKERLRLVLMTDHLELAPEMIEAMKRDLVDVISRFVEVDRERIDVSFERQDRTLAMLANIPIVSVNRPKHENGTPAPQAPAAASVAEPPPEVAAPVDSIAPPPPRKRRRRRKPQAAPPTVQPATASP